MWNFQTIILCCVSARPCLWREIFEMILYPTPRFLSPGRNKITSLMFGDFSLINSVLNNNEEDHFREVVSRLKGLDPGSLLGFPPERLPSLKKLLQTVLSGLFQLREGLVSPDRLTNTQHCPRPSLIFFFLSFKRNHSERPIFCLNGCPATLPSLSLLISFPLRPLTELRKALGSSPVDSKHPQRHRNLHKIQEEGGCGE